MPDELYEEINKLIKHQKIKENTVTEFTNRAVREEIKMAKAKIEIECLKHD